jgi:peptidoglycan/LPS O-acetylase OafA/YrhL
VHERLRTPLLIAALCVCVVFLKRPEYAAFAVGALMREARIHYPFPPVLAWPSLAFAIIFGAMMQGYAARNGLPQLPGMLSLGAPHQLWHVAAAAAAVYATLSLPALKRPLSSRLGRLLGDVSFGLYLVHVPLLYTVFVPAYIRMRGEAFGMVALFVAFLACSLIVAYVFTVLVDRQTIALIRRAQRAVKATWPMNNIAKADEKALASGEARQRNQNYL